jgi:hypothetical protein
MRPLLGRDGRLKSVRTALRVKSIADALNSSVGHRCDVSRAAERRTRLGVLRLRPVEVYDTRVYENTGEPRIDPVGWIKNTCGRCRPSANTSWQRGGSGARTSAQTGSASDETISFDDA